MITPLVTYKINNNHPEALESFTFIETGLPDEQCHDYALKVHGREAVEFIFSHVLDYYCPLDFESAKNGDLILFFLNESMNVKHSAILWEKNEGSINETTVRAKMANDSIFEHKLKDSPICYGNYVGFFRKIK